MMAKGGREKGKIVLLVALTVLLTNCTKKLPYEEVYKEDLISKSVIDTKSEFLFLASEGEADRNATGGLPYYTGEARLVKLEWNENSLDVIAQDVDARFADNPVNSKLILSIPVTHHEYGCAKDKYGKCTNKEEEKNDRNFAAKGQFKPDMAAVDIKSSSVMPTELTSLFGGNCYTASKPVLLSYEITEEAINIRQEISYETNLRCADIHEEADIAHLNFKVRRNYSIVRLNRLTTPNYKAVVYPKTDERTFGFFKTEVRKLSDDNRDIIKNEVAYLDRWSPTQKQIVYNLSPAFSKPENREILEATVQGVEQLNKSLNLAKAGIQIVLNRPDNFVSGDLRHSEIVLIEEPIRAGLLGYGPHVTDPNTGEIVYARTALYLGNMKKSIWREYDLLVKEKRNEKALALGRNAVKLSDALSGAEKEETQLPVLPDTPSVPTEEPQDIGKMAKRKKVFATAQMVHGLLERGKRPSKGFFDPIALQKNIELARGERYEVDDLFLKLMKYVKNPSRGLPIKADDSQEALKQKSLLLAQLENIDEQTAIALTGAYPESLFNFSMTLKGVSESILTEDLRFWDELSESEQKSAMSKILPLVWKPILVHELGHTLGLRHNFAGSEDEANIYTKAELQELGVDRPIPYSSVMEYTYSDISALPVLGKYDLAALRFGYAREVQLKDNSYRSLEAGNIEELKEAVGSERSEALKEATTLQEKADALKRLAKELENEGRKEEAEARAKQAEEVEILAASKKASANLIAVKAFKFCTDEHAGSNPNCNRFDEGFTNAQIAESIIKINEEFYKARNYRNGRRKFSMTSDFASLMSSNEKFLNLRFFFDRVKDIEEFRGKDIREIIKSDPSLALREQAADLLAASQIGFQHMLDVLSTPDQLCAIAEKKDPTTVVNLFPLVQIASVMDCAELAPLLNSDPNLNLMIVGQAGKSYASKKSIYNEDGRGDSIDLRGIWGEKYLALSFLLGRELGDPLFDSNLETYFEDVEMGPALLQALANLTLDNVVKDLNVEIFSTGQVLRAKKVPVSLTGKDHEINDPYIPASLAIAFDSYNGRNPFQFVLGKAIGSFNYNKNFHVTAGVLKGLFGVYQCDDIRSSCHGDITVKHGITTYAATADNQLAMAILEQLDIHTKVNALTEEQLLKVINAILTPGTDTSGFTKAEKAVFELGLEKLAALFGGQMKSVAEIERILVAMPKL